MTAESTLLRDSGPIAARRSPLAHREADLAAAGGPDLSLTERAFDAILNLRLPPESAAARELGLPGAGRAAPVNGAEGHALWLGPDEWLLVGPTSPAGHSTDVSANYATLVVAGKYARELLEKAITLDLHPRSFSPGHCAQTTFARGHVLLWQTGPQEYRLMFRPSFATYFADWLIDAAQEFR